MSERPQGDPIVNLDEALANAKKEKSIEDIKVEEEMVIPKKIQNRRTPTPLPSKAKPKNSKPKNKVKSADPANPYGYSEDDLLDHLVEDDSDLTKLGEFVDREIEAGPKFESTFEPVDKIEVDEELRQDEINVEPEEDDFVGFNRKTTARRKLRRQIADRRVREEDKDKENGIKFQNDLRSRAGQIVKNEQLESTPNIVENVTEKKPEKKKKLKSAVDVAMEKTQGIADGYNEKKLQKSDIEKAQSIEELLAAIDSSEGLQGSQEYFDKDKLKMIVEMVRDGKLDFEYITRSGGLRQKVFDLLNTKKEITPEAEIVSETVPASENEPEFIVEDAEKITPLPEDKLSGEVLDFGEKNKRKVGISRNHRNHIVNEMRENEVMPIDNQIILAEKDVANARKSFVNGWKNYDKIFREFSNKKKNPFKNFWLKITSAEDKIKQEYEHTLANQKGYHQKIDELAGLKVEKRLKEVLELRANSSERKKYEKVTISDLDNFLQKAGKNLPEDLANVADKKTEVDLKTINEDILDKKQKEELKLEVLTTAVEKEIASIISTEEKELTDRMFAESI